MLQVSVQSQYLASNRPNPWQSAVQGRIDLSVRRSIVDSVEALTSGVELFRLSLADLLRGVAMMKYRRVSCQEAFNQE